MDHNWDPAKSLTADTYEQNVSGALMVFVRQDHVKFAMTKRVMLP